MLTCLMHTAAYTSIHGFWTGAIGIAHRALQHFAILALLCLPLVGLRLQLFLQAEPTLFFCETLAQLLFSWRFFNPFSFGLSTKVLPVSSLELSLSWELNNPASLESLFFFAAMVRVSCLPIDGASVRAWVYMMEGAVGRCLRGKKSAVDSELR